jgi:hypothetical protein
MRKRLSRYALVLFVIAAVGFLCALATNELIGGIWSESRLYSHALRPLDQPEDEAKAYFFGKVQVVHDARFGQPIRLVRVTPYGAKQLVIFDRANGPKWSTELIFSEVDRLSPELPSKIRARIARAFEDQVMLAKNGGAEAALSVVDQRPEPWLDWYRDNGTVPDPESLRDAETIVLGPGIQIWYPKLLLFPLLWLLITGLSLWGLSLIVRRLSATQA